ncbi:hypothetical protein KIPB_004642, partial [Kipferlia bialata]
TNFGIWVDLATRAVTFQRRTGALGPQEAFYSYKKMIPSLTGIAQTMVTVMEETGTLAGILDANQGLDGASVLIFGEFYGGRYRDQTAGMIMVQPQIHYSPTCHFFPFDIAVCPEGDASVERENQRELAEDEGDPLPPHPSDMVYLSAHEVDSICEKAAGRCDLLTWATPVMVGTLEECKAIPVEGVATTIPGRLGLEPIPDNFWEGVVIRPLHQRGRHTIMKRKVNVMGSAGIAAAERAAKSKIRGSANANDTTDVLAPYRAAIDTIMTVDRATEIISHHGVAMKVIGRVIKEFSDEVMGLVMEGMDEAFFRLTDKTQAKLKKVIRKEAGVFVRQVFLQQAQG